MAHPVLGAILGEAGLAAAFRGLTKWALKWVGPVIVQGLAFLGISLVAINWGTGPIIAELQGAFSGAPAAFIDVIAFVNGDVAMSMILSAYVVRSAGRLVMRRAGG